MTKNNPIKNGENIITVAYAAVLACHEPAGASVKISRFIKPTVTTSRILHFFIVFIMTLSIAAIAACVKGACA